MKSTNPVPAPKAEELFLNAQRYEEKGDLKRAFECLQAAAKLGHISSQVNLGNFYAEGKGVRRNFEDAAGWYKQAYKSGDRTGALNLAMDRRNAGQSRSAVIWFKRAVAMNDGSACVELAKLYLSRNGEQKAATDLLQRVRLMNQADASELDIEEAESLLEKISKKRSSRGAAR